MNVSRTLAPVCAWIACLLTVVGTSGSFAGGKQALSFDHAISGSGSARFMDDSLNILAVMVEFQPDEDARTSGNGQFDLSTPAKPYLDAPPRDRGYFLNHLEFVRRYFSRVSNGHFNVSGTVLDSVYRLPNPMRAYSPGRGSTNNVELGNLMNDAWHLVDSLTPGIPYEAFDAFVIFHAGGGRDIDLVSLYGFDPTPFDIPSLYLNLDGLKAMFGPEFNGVAVRNGEYRITNSMILPETENREISGIGGTVLVKLGINGLFAASIGSHLGLPDLFNTKDGSSGIGRFGLMDGQSIFSWSGAFPPEPSPWEKYYLGWLDPIEIWSGDSVYELPGVSRAELTDTVYKVSISAREYFLVENRSRDANGDGTTVTMIVNGDTVRRTWARDTTGFHAFSQDSLRGVIIDVDEFDFSLPGGVNTRTNEWFNGGILIWHVDENIIEANRLAGSVNADAERRGVDLEEADGAQDIGQSYEFLSAGSGTEDGTPFDFWFDGNRSPARVGKNEFTPTSFPNSRSNAGGNSLITMKEFSPRGPRMRVRIQVGIGSVHALAGYPRPVTGSVRNFPPTRPGNSVKTADLNADGSADITIVSSTFASSLIFGWNSKGEPIDPDFYTYGLISRPADSMTNTFRRFVGTSAIGDYDGDGIPEIGTIERNFYPSHFQTSVFAAEFIDENADSLADGIFQVSESSAFPSEQVPTHLVMSGSLAVWADSAGVHFFSLPSGAEVNAVHAFSDGTAITGLALTDGVQTFTAVSSSGRVATVTPSGIVRWIDLPYRLESSPACGDFLPGLPAMIAIAATTGEVILLTNTLDMAPGFPVSTGGEILGSPALADIDADGRLDIVVVSGGSIVAMNAAGAVLDHFPIPLPSSGSVKASPVVADLDGNGTNDIVAVTADGLIAAYDRQGKMLQGFPLQGGRNGGSTPAIFYIPFDGATVHVGIASVSVDEHVYAWKTGSITGPVSNLPEMPWPQFQRDAGNSGFAGSSRAVRPRSNDFFPASLAYNWPNPVDAASDYKTNIRYYVSESATVRIRIFDLAGDLVEEISSSGVAGLDNEIQWDVSGIESGVYFAHLEARGATREGRAVIKIAVVK